MKRKFNDNSRPAWPAAGSFFGITAICGAAASEQNWPQWRGPLQNGVAPAANPPVTWSETNNIKWKVKIPGEGSATPLVWGNQIFVQAAIPTGKKVEPKTEETGDRKQDSAGRGQGEEEIGWERGASGRYGSISKLASCLPSLTV